MTSLAQVRRAAVRADAARAALHVAIREAHQAGSSLRQLAYVTDLSPETVRKITRAPR